LLILVFITNTSFCSI